jgi:hypothetical protein
LPEFQSFLSARKFVPEKNIRYYAYWASRFLAFCNERAGTDFSTAAMEFQQSLMTDQRIADWQIKQAEGAVRATKTVQLFFPHRSKIDCRLTLER